MKSKNKKTIHFGKNHHFTTLDQTGEPRKKFFVGNGISQFVDSESPLSIGLQTAPWPPKFKLVSLPKYNGFKNFRQFLMRYESAVNSAGGDDVALAKSFIIACEGPVLNWYSLLPPHSVCSWVDL
jgi:hypothetical protein